jgi:tetratricopeptide (TPR) repeat protein
MITGDKQPTPSQRERIAALEAKLRDRAISPEEQLDLALLHLEFSTTDLQIAFLAGHPTLSEREHIARLDAKLRDRTIDLDEQLELALLHLEPLHDGLRAVDLLWGILAATPKHPLARIWLVYCWIYEWMADEALRNAVTLCDELLHEDLPASLQAAALLLKASALRELGGESLAPLRESVALAPDWISNRQLLARIYEERGDRWLAAEQLRKAIALSLSRPDTGNYTDELFELLITGRGGELVANGLQEWLQKLTGER